MALDARYLHDALTVMAGGASERRLCLKLLRLLVPTKLLIPFTITPYRPRGPVG